MAVRVGIGQDSHRFLPPESAKPCIIGGVFFDEVPGLNANSDGDVIFHALCNAITSVTGIPILGGIADELCVKEGVTDSEVYLREGLKTLLKQKIVHIAITLEGKRPRFFDRIEDVRKKVAEVCEVQVSQVGLTATTGEGLTDFGLGEGVQAIAVITVEENTDGG